MRICSSSFGGLNLFLVGLCNGVLITHIASFGGGSIGSDKKYFMYIHVGKFCHQSGQTFPQAVNRLQKPSRPIMQDGGLQRVD